MSDIRFVRDGTISAPEGTEIDFRTPDYSVWLTIKADSDSDAERIAAALEEVFGEREPPREKGGCNARSDIEIEHNIASIRERMSAALAHDQEALDLLDRVFPDDWGRAPEAVIWMLGNAARFATNTNGIGAGFAQDWLDRLVHPDGTPIEGST